MIENIEPRLEALRLKVSYILDNEVQIPPDWMNTYIFDILFFCRLHIDEEKTRGARFFARTLVSTVYDVDDDTFNPESVLTKYVFSTEANQKIKTMEIPSRKIAAFAASLMITYPMILTNSVLAQKTGFAIEIFDQHEKILNAVAEYTEIKKSVK